MLLWDAGPQVSNKEFRTRAGYGSSRHQDSNGGEHSQLSAYGSTRINKRPGASVMPMQGRLQIEEMSVL